MSDLSALTKAITFATQAHGEQRDKQGQPYIFHPLNVMLRVASGQSDGEQSEGASQIDYELLSAAVLHDVLEDCTGTSSGAPGGAPGPSPVTPLQIYQDFGEAIYALVYAVTRQPGEPYMEYIERVSRNKRATIIKLADLRDNMGRPGQFPRRDSLMERYEKAVEYLTNGSHRP